METPTDKRKDAVYVMSSCCEMQYAAARDSGGRVSIRRGGYTQSFPLSFPDKFRAKGQPKVPTLISQPTRIQAAGTKPKLIDEYIGRVNSDTESASVAHMRSPAGWEEPGQRPEFDEFTLVLKGMVRVTHSSGSLDVHAGQAVIAHAGEWVRYSTPEGAEYVAICVPAFSLEAVHRDV
jgi:mannose-6-phosphate isomerase-like protein (cupin superfamily)